MKYKFFFLIIYYKVNISTLINRLSPCSLLFVSLNFMQSQGFADSHYCVSKLSESFSLLASMIFFLEAFGIFFSLPDDFYVSAPCTVVSAPCTVVSAPCTGISALET